jgi:hypothetical protein
MVPRAGTWWMRHRDVMGVVNRAKESMGLIVHSLRFIHETPSIMDERFLHCGRGECLERE